MAPRRNLRRGALHSGPAIALEGGRKWLRDNAIP